MILNMKISFCQQDGTLRKLPYPYSLRQTATTHGAKCLCENCRNQLSSNQAKTSIRKSCTQNGRLFCAIFLQPYPTPASMQQCGHEESDQFLAPPSRQMEKSRPRTMFWLVFEGFPRDWFNLCLRALMRTVTEFKGLMRHHQKEGAESLLEETRAKNFPNTRCYLKVRRTRDPHQDYYNPTVKTQRKWILKAAPSKKWFITYKGETLKVTRLSGGKFKVLTHTEKYCIQQTSFQNQEEIKIFLDKQKRKDKEFITTTAAVRVQVETKVQETVTQRKEVLRQR